MKVKPKKWLGQHFLHDERVCKRIADLTPTDTGAKVLLEVGPGTGALTRFLPETAFERVLLVDVDKESIDYLNLHFKRLPFEIMEADFLKQDLQALAGGEMVVVGNFPYNISSQIFFKLIEYKDTVPAMVGMVQKEVAKRIVTGPGSREYGILSVLLQTWYHIHYAFTVKPGSFTPAPKVESGVLTLKRNNRTELPIPEAFYMRMVKEAFNQRRKTLRNALSSLLAGRSADHPMLAMRAEQLSVDNFLALGEWIRALPG